MNAKSPNPGESVHFCRIRVEIKTTQVYSQNIKPGQYEIFFKKVSKHSPAWAETNCFLFY